MNRPAGDNTLSAVVLEEPLDGPGLVLTQALRAGASSHASVRQTRHRGPVTLKIYAYERAPLVGNVVTVVGL